jgi:hypothetical protein
MHVVQCQNKMHAYFLISKNKICLKLKGNFIFKADFIFIVKSNQVRN